MKHWLFCLILSAVMWVMPMRAQAAVVTPELFRLQVVAESDSEADQDMKLQVRNAVLVLAEQIDGCRYETLVYYYDDHLREMFCQAGSEIPLEFGEQILELKGFTARMEGSQLNISLQMKCGATERMLLHLRSGLEADNEE